MDPVPSPSTSRPRDRSSRRSVRWFVGLIRAALLAGVVDLATSAAAGAVSCTVTTAPVDFGTYDPMSASPKTSNGYIDMRCTCSGTLDCVSASYTISLGAGASGAPPQRYLTSPAVSTRLAYNLYQDANDLILLGAGSASVSLTYTVALFGSYQRTLVYGKLPGLQNARPAVYGDSVPVSIAF